MTSDEIRRTPATDLSASTWMREICLQLALLNEKQMPCALKEVPATPEKRGPGRPPKVRVDA